MQEIDRLEPFKQLSRDNQRAMVRFLEFLELKQKAQEEYAQKMSLDNEDGSTRQGL